MTVKVVVGIRDEKQSISKTRVKFGSTGSRYRASNHHNSCGNTSFNGLTHQLLLCCFNMVKKSWQNNNRYHYHGATYYAEKQLRLPLAVVAKPSGYRGALTNNILPTTALVAINASAPAQKISLLRAVVAFQKLTLSLVNVPSAKRVQIVVRNLYLAILVQPKHGPSKLSSMIAVWH